MSAPPHVVVTGAAGFVGGYLARWFAARGHPVMATVRASRAVGAFPAQIAVIAGDLADPGHVPKRFDVLIHCAAETPARCPDPERLYASNVEAARALFARARAAGAATVVYMSSMSVYGRISAPVVAENLTPADVDRYGQSKREGERLLENGVQAGLASGLSLRLPGTVGRGSHDNFLSDALRRARASGTLKGRHPDALFNNIVFVGHLARFLEDWIAAPRPGYSVANLAARDPIPVRRVFSTLFAALGLPERIVYETGGKAPFLISIERALGLGYRAPSVEESVRLFVRDSIGAEPDPATAAARAMAGA